MYREQQYFQESQVDRILQSLDTMTEEVTKLSSNPEHIILSNVEAQQLLKVSSKTLQKWREAGKIEYSKIGREIYYSLRQVLDMLERHKVSI